MDVAFGVVLGDALIGGPCVARDHVMILDPTCEVQPRNDIQKHYEVIATSLSCLNLFRMYS
jgi:hypothetical protein